MDPIIRIRQFIDTHPDCWAADCFRKYLQGAHEGVSLEQAFGLTVGPREGAVVAGGEPESP